jgi:hypothetical protein
MDHMELIKNYSPHIYFDKEEPFFPVRIGVTVFDAPGKSLSFPRAFEFADDCIQYVIEYAIYWDYDIQHLYELEHVWMFIGQQGEVIDCEASFHGRYLKGLLRDKRNLVNTTHVKLYSQPGKHAFSPLIELFELLPDLETSTYARAGTAGLIITDVFEGIYFTSTEKNELVYNYLQQFKFKPSMEFVEYDIPEELYVPWNKLFHEIPLRIEKRLAEMRKDVSHEQNR